MISCGALSSNASNMKFSTSFRWNQFVGIIQYQKFIPFKCVNLMKPHFMSFYGLDGLCGVVKKKH